MNRYKAYTYISWLLLFLLGGIGYFPAEADAATVKVAVSAANVRSTPNTNAQISGSILQNTEVDALEWSGEWVRIRYGNVEGWMHKSVLAPTIYIEVAVTKANLRSGAGTNFNTLEQLDQGSVLFMITAEGDWYHVKTAAGQEGYVRYDLIKPTDRTFSSETVSSAASASSFLEVDVLNANLRENAGTNYLVVAQVRQGEVLAILKTAGDWYEVQTASGKTGYIRSDLVRPTSRTIPLTAASAPDPASAANSAVPSASSGDLSIYLDGKPLQFTDAQPVIVDGRTLVPLRSIFEAMEATVDWDAATQTVTSTRGNTTVVLKIGSATPTVNGQTVTLDVPGQIMQNRTMVPLRFVSEAFGGQVNWDAESRRVDIAVAPLKAPEIENPNLQPSTPVAELPVEEELYGEVMHVGARQDEKGLSVIISSIKRLDPTVDKNKNVLTYTFAGFHLQKPVSLEQPIGSGKLVLEGKNVEKSVVITIKIPEDAGYRLTESENGREIAVELENQITSVGREVYSQNGERIMLKTLVPVQYEFATSEREINLVLKYSRQGMAREQYDYIGALLDYMTIKEVETKDGYDVHITVRTKKDAFFNTLLTNDGMLNIVASVQEGATYQPPVSSTTATVVLDPGHGGAEIGASRDGILEKDINLSITLKVGAILEANGITVAYTRKSDIAVGLEERARIANEMKASIFVSIHSNAVDSTTVQGTETYFYAPFDTPALFEQRTERVKLAEEIHNALIPKINRPNRGVKEKNLSVLRNTQMPSALAEVAFLSNAEERALLINSGFQQRAAEGIAAGIIKYLNSSGQTVVINPFL